ncbi:chorismate-binding protein [Frankia sp. AiPa1]|nr:chorismate-binding protein [Frankia sp. AiPa1]
MPFRQLTEAGLPCVDDGVPLEALRVTDQVRISLADTLAALAALPAGPPAVRDGAFDIDDEGYTEHVRAVLRDEIGHGEGSNFVLHRTFTATVDGPPLRAALTALRHLLRHEPSAYWTFLIHTGRRTFVGASPERHVSVAGGQVTMNPICGTHHLPPDRDQDLDWLLRFLADPKETDELSMVLDEELKMMARITEHGGRAHGPRLRRMSRLVHTEYLLTGRSDADIRDILRETMFAPTVTGSPLRNALRVIARHERRGRRYYGGVAALLGLDGTGRQTLDAPILIRTAELTPDGILRVPVGATLVRHSTPHGEAAETRTKAAAILSAFGLPSASPASSIPASSIPIGAIPISAIPAANLSTAEPWGADAAVAAALAGRNAGLAAFWLDRASRPGMNRVVPAPPTPDVSPTPDGSAQPRRSALAGRSVLIVDAEDAFAGMLGHLLDALGLAVTIRPWTQVGNNPDGAELLVVGPGPGDPTAHRGGDPKMAALRGLVERRLARRAPLLAVCLGHQVLAELLGLPLRRRPDPHQGLARAIDLFGRPRRVGFYSTFTAVCDADVHVSALGPVQLARDPADGAVHALRGAFFTGLQFHPESALSLDGMDILRAELTRLLGAAPAVHVG